MGASLLGRADFPLDPSWQLRLFDHLARLLRLGNERRGENTKTQGA
jgi:hypothetical protein